MGSPGSGGAGPRPPGDLQFPDTRDEATGQDTWPLVALTAARGLEQEKGCCCVCLALVPTSMPREGDIGWEGPAHHMSAS